MIKAIINGVFSLIISLVNLLLVPIDNVITRYLPSLSSGLSVINGFFDSLGDVVPWVISFTGLSSTTINLIIDLIVFIYTAPILVQSVKLAIKWFDKLKV